MLSNKSNKSMNHLNNSLSSEVFQQENAISRIQLKLISPEKQLQQFIRVLPNGSITGQVMNSQTLNYKTLKPEKGGFFCERIFGPTQDFVCACGKRQKTNSCLYCSDCEVEYTSSKVRRYRLGFIRLGVPIAHIWYLKGRPSYISLLLDLKKKHAESIAYGTTCIFHNYSPEFGKRVQKLRLTFNENFSDLRRAANQRPGFFQLRLKMREQLRRVMPFVDQKGDDFWVQSTTLYGYFCHWKKKDFLRKKPFYQLPLIRDRFNFIYRGYPDNLYALEDYLFNFKRTYGSIQLPKYKKAIANSMVCYNASRNIELLLTGGIAFIHLFSKIDCYRFQLTLFHELSSIREAIVYLNESKRRRVLTKKELKELQSFRRQVAKLARRIKLLRTFWRTGSRPEWMFISILPILPPDLRPIIKMSNDQLAVSDLNRLYQSVFHRNRNLKLSIANIYFHLGIDFTQIDDDFDFSYNYQAFRFSTSVVSFQQKLLQEAVDALLENGKGGAEPICGSNNRPLKSLSDILKGKKGRFRQNLLGKRVDYSGRSVIVVGPKLKLYQCGLPKELALELFQSLLIRKLMLLKIIKSIVSAKQLIRLEHPIIWPILSEVMADSPVFLNRAPTLHRLGVQAFLPKLVRGKAILLHPLVCPAFNADFDGDQMGVHLPLSIEAKSEAWSLMLSTQNILSPATGDPILTPTQDMVLGCYYLTTINTNLIQYKNIYFYDLEDVFKAYSTKHLHAHDFIWLRWNQKFFSTQPGKKIIEIRLKYYKKQIYETIKMTSHSHKTYFIHKKINKPLNSEGVLKNQFIRTTVGRVIMNQEYQKQMNTNSVKYTQIKIN